LDLPIEKNIIELKNELTDNISIIAVTKTRNIEEINQCFNMGLRDFGENKVQELLTKMEHFGNDVRWHLIGHLQRNKVKSIVGKVYLIQSLDSIQLLNEIEKRYSERGLIANALIEVNVGEEENKTGLSLKDLDSLITAIECSSNVKVCGLMSVIPKGDEKSCRDYFRKVKNLYDDLSTITYKNINMDILSMGMTNDYKYAVLEGSNMVRIGEGIFGKRSYTNKSL
jgi:PLP dependent protein